MTIARKITALLAMCAMAGFAMNASAYDHHEGEAKQSKSAASQPHAAMDGDHDSAMNCCKKADKCGLVCGQCSPDSKAKVGEAAINFKLKDLDGKAHQLSDFKEKIVVLTWVNQGCPFIQYANENKLLDQMAAKYKDQNVVFLNIDSSKDASVDQTKAVVKEHQLTVPVMMDQSGAVGRMYGAKTTPDCFVIGKDGKLAYAGALDNAPMGKVKGEQMVNYVDQAVSQLLAGEPVKVKTTESYGCGVKYAKPENSAMTMPQDDHQS